MPLKSALGGRWETAGRPKSSGPVQPCAQQTASDGVLFSSKYRALRRQQSYLALH